MSATDAQLVQTKDTAEPYTTADGVSQRDLAPAIADSPVWMTYLELAPDAILDLTAADDDQVFFVTVGDGRVVIGREQLDVRERVAFRVDAGENASLAAGVGGLEVVRGGIGPSADVHAPLGEPQRLISLSAAESQDATGDRTFQVLFSAENGFLRGTLFYGMVPPGAAPWHIHLYDEVMWVDAGETLYRQAGLEQQMVPASVVRIRPRLVHINENVTEDDIAILGLFTPSGSPSAAYYALDPNAD